MEGALTRLRYNMDLLNGGLNFGESGYAITTAVSIGSRAAAEISDATASGIILEPDTWIGAAGYSRSPVNVYHVTGGTKQSGTATSAARILNGVAEAATSFTGLLGTQGGWDRQTQEWHHQVDVITLEIQQIKRQTQTA